MAHTDSTNFINAQEGDLSITHGYSSPDLAPIKRPGAKMSRQVQFGAQKPPPRRTTYTPRDTTTPSDTNPSRQVQLVPRNPTVATATTQEQDTDRQQSCICTVLGPTRTAPSATNLGFSGENRRIRCTPEHKTRLLTTPTTPNATQPRTIRQIRRVRCSWCQETRP